MTRRKVPEHTLGNVRATYRVIARVCASERASTAHGRHRRCASRARGLAPSTLSRKPFSGANGREDGRGRGSGRACSRPRRRALGLPSRFRAHSVPTCSERSARTLRCSIFLHSRRQPSPHRACAPVRAARASRPPGWADLSRERHPRRRSHVAEHPETRPDCLPRPRPGEALGKTAGAQAEGEHLRVGAIQPGRCDECSGRPAPRSSLRDCSPRYSLRSAPCNDFGNRFRPSRWGARRSRAGTP